MCIKMLRWRVKNSGKKKRRLGEGDRQQGHGRERKSDLVENEGSDSSMKGGEEESGRGSRKGQDTGKEEGRGRGSKTEAL